MRSKLSLWISILFLNSCGGGGGGGSAINVNTQEIQRDEIQIPLQVINGIIKNSDIKAEHFAQNSSDNSKCIRVYNNEPDVIYNSSFTEDSQSQTYFLKTQQPATGNASTGNPNFRVTALGGEESRLNISLTNLKLINDQIDRYSNPGNRGYYKITPLTTAEYFFNRNLNKCEINPVNTKINGVLGISEDENFDINTFDHLGPNEINARKIYEINNKLTSLALALNNYRNHLLGGSQTTDDIFLILTDQLADSYELNPTQTLNLKSETFLSNFLSVANSELVLGFDAATKNKLLVMLKNMMKVIQYKNSFDANINSSATDALVKFSKTTFLDDFLKVAKNEDTDNVYQFYENNLVQRISQISGVDASYLNFQLKTEPLSLTTPEDTPLGINIMNYIQYDVNESLNVSFQNPQNGTLTKDSSNFFTYTPNLNFFGTDFFYYTLEQGTNSQDGYVGITVTSIVDKPIFSNISSPINVLEGNTFIANINATDPDGGSISYTLSGTDADKVTMSASGGALNFKEAPNFDVKSSYNFSITASNLNGQTSLNLVVNILNDNNQIDLLIYYAPDMLTKYTADHNIETKMEYLVSSLNNSLVRSEADISFNLKKLLPYDIDISNQTAEQILNVSTERAKIKQDQILYGADYHVIVSRWNIEKGTTLGLASLDTAIDSSDWDFWAGELSNWTADPDWQELECTMCVPDKVFSHELGHNLGSAHWPGSPGQSYAFGHRVDGNLDGDYLDSEDWGTIMSYNDISPDYFSNPEVNCKVGEPCGVLNVSDNTRWFDSYGSRFSNILPATYLSGSGAGFKINLKNFFPMINGGSSIYSNAGNQRTFSITSLGTFTESNNTYNIFKWENSVSGQSKMAFHFYELNGEYLVIRSDYEDGYYFSGVDEYTLYSSTGTDMCLFAQRNSTIGNNLSRTCKNAYEGNPPNYNDTFHFSNFIKEESITVPYGTYDAIKFAFVIWDNSKEPSSLPPYLMHVIFWFNNEVGIVQYRDHLGRIWKLESADTDGDGQDNKTDNDDDNDGVLDTNDAFKLDPDSSTDSNADGIPD